MAETQLSREIACVAREITQRRRVYPRWVDTGRYTKQKADYEIATMEAVLVRLQSLPDPERLL